MKNLSWALLALALLHTIGLEGVFLLGAVEEDTAKFLGLSTLSLALYAGAATCHYLSKE